MHNMLKELVDEEIALVNLVRYSSTNDKEYLLILEEMNKEGKIKGSIDDDVWMCNSGIKNFGVNFNFSDFEYYSHAKRILELEAYKVKQLMKYYVLHICGQYIFLTIADRVRTIKKFLTNYGDEAISLDSDSWCAIAEFLGFIQVPLDTIFTIKNTYTIYSRTSDTRKLAHLINYIAIASKINELYKGNLSDDEFCKWFPVYFWVQITFILPLRATEMLVTPYDFLVYRGNNVYMRIKRTVLKGGGKQVYYDVDKDYKVFEYQVPKTKVITVIEKYRELTKNNDRKCLFSSGNSSVNGFFSLQSFNMLLEAFITEYLIGNRKYDYAKFACGIEEFSIVTAGDSRPIAMANLLYQQVGSDICRQLANHINLSTSAGYYNNVSNTIFASTIMQIQQKINSEYKQIAKLESDKEMLISPIHVDSFCNSPDRPKITGKISHCKEAGILNIDDDCIGCRYYAPTKEELERIFEKRKSLLVNRSKTVMKCLFQGLDKKEPDIEKEILDLYTSIARFEDVCNMKGDSLKKKWQRHQSTMTTSY